MSRVRTITQEKKPANYRFGQDFTYENIRFAWRRQGYGHKIVVGCVDDAIGKGFNIMDITNEEPIKIDNNQEAMEIINSLWVDIKKPCYYESAYGKGLGSFFQNKQSLDPFFRAWDTRGYYAQYDKLGQTVQYDVTNKVGGTHASAELQTLMGDELGRAYEIIIREDEEKGEGLSIIEPVWDTLFALSSLDENGTYY